LGQLFTWVIFEMLHIGLAQQNWDTEKVMNWFDQKCVGQYFGLFFTQSSGHPASVPADARNLHSRRCPCKCRHVRLNFPIQKLTKWSVWAKKSFF
jgi:hypothetical protein